MIMSLKYKRMVAVSLLLVLVGVGYMGLEWSGVRDLWREKKKIRNEILPKPVAISDEVEQELKKVSQALIQSVSR